MQGDAVGSWLLQLAAMCAFMLAFSVSWAGIFWVLLSELFSMSVKSPAVAAATAALFLTGAMQLTSVRSLCQIQMQLLTCARCAKPSEYSKVAHAV